MTPLIKNILEEFLVFMLKKYGHGQIDRVVAGQYLVRSLTSLQASVEARKDDEFRAAVEEIFNRFQANSNMRGAWPHEYSQGEHLKDCRGCELLALHLKPKDD